MKSLALITATATLILTGCTQDAQDAQDLRDTKVSASQVPESVAVESGAIRELCFVARKDAELLFRFEADGPLLFNFHYHIDDEVFYPVPEHETAAEKGQYLVPKDETYCLMWTNASNTTIDLSARVEGASQLVWY